MNFTPVKTPKAIKFLFSNYIWNINNNNKTIYLTFDDGPTSGITPWTLDILKSYNAKATFFCIGNNVIKHPEIFNQIINEGHSIGNHTYNHIKGWKTKTKAYIEDISNAQNTIDLQTSNSRSQIENIDSLEIRNQKSETRNLFRPPYGQIKPKQGIKLIALGYKIIMWDVLSVDWSKSISKEQCLKHVLDNTESGSIVVFHDSIKASHNLQYALPKVLEHFSEAGYTFKRIAAQDL